MHPVLLGLVLLTLSFENELGQHKQFANPKGLIYSSRI